MTTQPAYVSIHGKRIGLTPRGLRVDNRMIMPGGRIDDGGDVYYVSSVTGNTSSNGKDTQHPVKTLDAAFALTKANNADVIAILPNHSETITGVGGIAHDVAGVSVIGTGTYGQRPRFLMDGAATVTYLISAADAFVTGLDLVSGQSNVATAIGVTAPGAHIDNLKFSNNTTNEDFLVCITATGADDSADGMKVTNCGWHTIDTDDTAMINIANNLLDFVALGNKMISASATASQFLKCEDGAILLNGEIGYNKCFNLMTTGELFISNNQTVNSGVIYNNFSGHADVTTTHDNGWDTGGWRLFDNLSVSTVALQGGIIPGADVDL